jgi:hypothetical protein
MRGRMDLLRRMWTKEHHAMVMMLAKNKTKSSKKQKEFLAKVRAIPDSIKEAMLDIYLEKCKQQNAVEFFDWHRRVFGAKGEAKKRDAGQSFLINMRISRIKRHEKNLYLNAEDIIYRELKNYED